MRFGCLKSAAGFLGRPPFRGASARKVNCSRVSTNSGLPRGRPVCASNAAGRPHPQTNPCPRETHATLPLSIAFSSAPFPARGAGPSDRCVRQRWTSSRDLRTLPCGGLGGQPVSCRILTCAWRGKPPCKHKNKHASDGGCRLNR